MITGELKNKIDSLWDIFAAGGLVNPLDVIEQITYLMFIHDLDDSDNRRAKEAAMLGLPYQSIFADEVQIGERIVDGRQLKWSVFHDFPAAQMYTVVQESVFPFIKNLHGDKNSAYSKYMDDAIFKLPTPLLLSKVVDALDEIYRLMSGSQAADVRGDTYEYLLSKISQSGLNGQFRTPRHIIRMMVELMDPKADDVICDPACGTSGFLVSAGEYLKERRKEEIFFNRQKKDHYMNHMFFGYDMDRTMLRIGAMNMMAHGIDNPFIEYRDSLSDQNPDKGKYSLILANPPFKGSLDADTVSADLLKVCKTKKTELLVSVVFEILEKLLDCDLSEFVDKKKEDFLIKKSSCTFIGEIKGVTSNVKHEHISQIELHYRGYLDRLDDEGISESVKQLLIINPFRSKPLDQREPVHKEQITLAERNGCLIIETHTLMRMYENYCLGLLTAQRCEEIFAKCTGVLKKSDFDDSQSQG